ncbi:MAG: inositol monophosphatase family protein [Rickettsiales bacterium]|nr:inositol monophosphatase family protein [Rickettsiales bacterium]
MRHSANLNIIIKAIEKATAHMSRDFIELENLQSNPFSAGKFANACYNRVKQVLADDLSKLRPQYNLIFSDGQNLIRKKDAEYSYIIHPIDGFANLTRSNPDFTVAIALEHQSENAVKESISVAISKIFGGEIFYCEKGFGAYSNNRRIRVSKRTGADLIMACEDQDLVNDKNQILRSYGCRTMELAYVASARLEKAIFKNQNTQFLKPFALLVREAGGKIIEEEKSITVSN